MKKAKKATRGATSDISELLERLHRRHRKSTASKKSCSPGRKGKDGNRTRGDTRVVPEPGTVVKVPGSADIVCSDWQRLQGHLGPDCPLLTINPLYPLPGPVLDILRREVPDLLGPLDTAERQLTEFCAAGHIDGFFNGSGVNSEMLQFVPPDRLREGMIEQYRLTLPGKDDAEIREAVQKLEADSEAALNSCRGYVGWLFTKETFLGELRDLKQLGGQYVQATGEFPVIDWIRGGVGCRDTESRRDRGFPDAYKTFCTRWCLQRLVTWDVAEPTGPQLPVLVKSLSPDMAAQGFRFFVPFSYLFPGKLNLHDLAKDRLKDLVPEHLRGWRDERTSAWERYVRFFKFLHLWNTVTLRHGAQLRSNRSRLKQALGRYLAGDKSWGDDIEQGHSLSDKLHSMGNVWRKFLAPHEGDRRAKSGSRRASV